VDTLRKILSFFQLKLRNVGSVICIPWFTC